MLRPCGESKAHGDRRIDPMGGRPIKLEKQCTTKGGDSRIVVFKSRFVELLVCFAVCDVGLVFHSSATTCFVMLLTCDMMLLQLRYNHSFGLKMSSLQLLSGFSDSTLTWAQSFYLWMFLTGLLMNLWICMKMMCCCWRCYYTPPPEVVTRAEAGMEWAKRQRALDPAFPSSYSRENPGRGGLASLIRRRY